MSHEGFVHSRASSGSGSAAAGAGVGGVPRWVGKVMTRTDRLALTAGAISLAAIGALWRNRATAAAFVEVASRRKCYECGASGPGVVDPAAGLCHLCLNGPTVGPHYRSPDGTSPVDVERSLRTLRERR